MTADHSPPAWWETLTQMRNWFQATWPRADADELIADVAFRLFETIGCESQLSPPYIRRVAYNLVVDRVRRTQSETQRTRAWAMLHRLDGCDEIGRASAESQVAKVGAALRQLSDEQRALIEMRHVQEMSFGQLSAVFNRSPEALRSECRRILADLRQKFRTHNPSEEWRL